MRSKFPFWNKIKKFGKQGFDSDGYNTDKIKQATYIGCKTTYTGVT